MALRLAKSPSIRPNPGLNELPNLDGQTIVQEMVKVVPKLRDIPTSQLQPIIDTINKYFDDYKAACTREHERFRHEIKQIKEEKSTIEKELQERILVCKEYEQHFGNLKNIAKTRREREEKAVVASKELEATVDKMKESVVLKDEEITKAQHNVHDTESLTNEIAELKVHNKAAIASLNEELARTHEEIVHEKEASRELRQKIKEKEMNEEGFRKMKTENVKLKTEVYMLRDILSKRKKDNTVDEEALRVYKQEITKLNKTIQVQDTELKQQKKTITGNERRK